MKESMKKMANDCCCGFVAVATNDDKTHLESAVVGFDTPEDAEIFAQDNNGEVVIIRCEKGENIYTIHETTKNGIDLTNFLHNNQFIVKGCCEFENWAKKKILNMIDDCDTLNDIKIFTNWADYVLDEIDDMGIYDVAIITESTCGYDYEILYPYVTSYETDDVVYKVAVIENEEKVSIGGCEWTHIDDDKAIEFMNSEETWVVAFFTEGKLYMNNLDGWMMLAKNGDYFFSWI
jgi:hypothetical protein